MPFNINIFYNLINIGKHIDIFLFEFLFAIDIFLNYKIM